MLMNSACARCDHSRLLQEKGIGDRLCKVVKRKLVLSVEEKRLPLEKAFLRRPRAERLSSANP
jgi:hypothetical protein